MRSRIAILCALFILLSLLINPTEASVNTGSRIKAAPAYNNVYVNSSPYVMDAYNIGGYTYYKLRALAYAANISIRYDGAANTVYIDTAKPYDKLYKTEALSISNQNGSQTAYPAASNIVINGSPIHIECYLIGGYNFFKLRDFTDNIGASVQYDDADKSVFISVKSSFAYGQSAENQSGELLNNGIVWNEVTYTQANDLFYSGNSDMVFVYYSGDDNKSSQTVALYRTQAEQSDVKVFALDKNAPENVSDPDKFFGDNYSSADGIALPTIYVVNDSNVDIYDHISDPGVIDNFFTYLSSDELSQEEQEAIDVPPPAPVTESVITDTLTNTPAFTATPTSAPTPAATYTPIPTATYTPTDTPTPIPTATYSPTPTATFTPAPTATFTPVPAAAFKPMPKATYTPVPTPRPAPKLSPRPTASPRPTLAPAAAVAPITAASRYNTNIQYINKVIELVNTERTKAGLSTLAADPALMEAALYKCQNISNTRQFSHDSSTYGKSYVLMDLFDIKYAAWGENIASGQLTPEEVMNAWMNSPGHRDNILSEKYQYIGVGFLYDDYFGTIWSQEFLKKQ